MAKSVSYIKRVLHELDKIQTLESVYEQLEPLNKKQLSELEDLSYSIAYGEEGYNDRINRLKELRKETGYLTGEKSFTDYDALKGNVENFIGMAQIPVGLAGPIYINGKNAQGDYLIPLATTEGALVASYNRGMKACRLSGGITSICLVEGVQRSPYFKFKNVAQVGFFIKWVHEHVEEMEKIVTSVSRFAKLNEVNSNIEGNSVILTFEYYTGDAAGQNMVTICTDRICQYILENIDIKPVQWYIESNYSGDKKATALSFSNVRGKKVTSEVVISREIVDKVLKTTPEDISKYWIASTLAVTQSGSIGAQGHVANGLTALFIACGQDVACISESSVGLTRMEVTEEGDLYASLTLPSLIVGTVGGGTNLPTQKECLELMDCYGAGNARKFAEICCAVALSGEISIASAMSANHFTSAHEKLGRKENGSK